jgi:hypothetical protein
MINLVREICERKRGKVHPEGATELELKHELSRQGVTFTADSFRQMCDQLLADPHIRAYRTLNHIAYAYITEATEESLLTQERGAGATHPHKHAILSEPTVAQSAQELPRSPSPMPGVSEDGEDNTSDDRGSHHADKFWWSEI